MFTVPHFRYANIPAPDAPTAACREAIAQAFIAEGTAAALQSAQLARAGHYDDQPEMAIARRAYRAGRDA